MLPKVEVGGQGVGVGERTSVCRDVRWHSTGKLISKMLTARVWFHRLRVFMRGPKADGGIAQG